MNAMLAVIVPSLGWALLDFVWQGLLIGCLAAIGMGLLRGARPQLRYAVGCAALLLCAALPLAGTVQRMLDAQAAATTILPLRAIAMPAGEADAPLLAAPMLAAQVASWEPALQQRLPLLMFFWSCGAGLLALRLMLGLAWVRRRSQPGRYLRDAAWQARVDRLALRFGVARKVALGLVGDLPGPVTAGWWRPVILVPASLVSGMPPDLLEALLAHEMAHIKRFDYLVNLIQSAIEMVLFYHPAVWWLSHRVRIEREQIADDLAASMLGEPRRLALALSELDQFQFSTPQLAHGAHGGNLMSRIKRLVRPDTEPLNWKMALPILGLSAACAAFYANAQTAPLAPATAVYAGSAPAIAPAPPAPPARPAVPALRVGAAVPAAPMDAAPLPPVPPAPPAPPAPPRLPVSITKGPGEMSYALVQGPERKGMLSGDSRDVDDIAAAKHTVQGDFLWFRQGDQAYVVQDPALIARVSVAYAPLKRLGAQMEVHGKEMEKHAKVVEQLGREMERKAGADQPEHAETRRIAGLIAALAPQQARLQREIVQLERQIDDVGGATRAQLSARRDQLNVKLSDIERQLDVQHAQLERQHGRIEQARAPLDAIDEQMKEAGKPMDALGKKMNVLGREMDQHGKAAERVMREVLRDAVARGLARPVPGPRAS
ncbi:M56 family metallopeptidase [Massilia genomosp. 1]|uniref:M48 family metalloprotease n=1 Tax=Massilia genomosp. 1 TaxID=2609280 RepID=A0ABX0MF80_9BURK|nr:M56 family metallopeptidase [Massilia genomosp. 1]NHZ60971.1 M48 family metalloprotease [Massilia genomosp. 1]